MIAYINNDFIEEENAVLKVEDLALQRGYAAFDFLRTKNSVPLFLDDYLERFFHSAAQMYLQPEQTKDDVKTIIYELIKKNKLPESGIRLVLTGGYSPDGYSIATPNLVMLQQKLNMLPNNLFRAGLKVITHEYQRDLPTVKSINYLMGIWLQQKINACKAADVLYHQNGNVSEFPRANVFIVTKDEKIVTPAENILKGITRMRLLKLMQDKFDVEVRPLRLDEVKDAAEVFMTSTTKRVLPICQVDEHLIGEGKAGPIATFLNQLFLEMEDRYATF